jgi:hypothetical protein
MSYEDYTNQKKVVQLNNGDTYEGSLQGKTKHGYGVYRYANGDVYDGDW